MQLFVVAMASARLRSGCRSAPRGAAGTGQRQLDAVPSVRRPGWWGLCRPGTRELGSKHQLVSFPSDGFSGTASMGDAPRALTARQIVRGLILCPFRIPLEDCIGLKMCFDQKTESLSAKVAENERGALASWDIGSGTDPAVSWCTHGSPWQGAATAGARLWKHSLRSRAGSPALCSPRNACGTVLPSCDCPPGRSFTSRPALSAPGLFAKALAVRSENVWLLILGTASQTQAAGEDACVRVFGCCPLWPVGSCLKPENWMKS